MTKIVKVILTYVNPTKLEFLKLSNLIYTGKSLTNQEIHISERIEYPSIYHITNQLYYSNTRLDNLKLSHALSLNEITSEYLSQFKLDKDVIIYPPIK